MVFLLFRFEGKKLWSRYVYPIYGGGGRIVHTCMKYRKKFCCLLQNTYFEIKFYDHEGWRMPHCPPQIRTFKKPIRWSF